MKRQRDDRNKYGAEFFRRWKPRYFPYPRA
jgi:hypothetical protein